MLYSRPFFCPNYRNVLGRPVVDVGDISERLELRQRLQCKPFSFFLNEVWPESDVRNLTRDVPYMGTFKWTAAIIKHIIITLSYFELNKCYAGRLRNIGSDLCITSSSARPETNAQLNSCSGPGMMYFK